MDKRLTVLNHNNLLFLHIERKEVEMVEGKGGP